MGSIRPGPATFADSNSISNSRYFRCRARPQFDECAVQGEVVHAPGVSRFDHRAGAELGEQPRPCDLVSGVGVAPDNPILGVCTYLLAGRHGPVAFFPPCRLPVSLTSRITRSPKR